MKLFDPERAGCFVYAVVAKNAREGTPPTYTPYQAREMESAERTIDSTGMRNAYPHVMGRYDEKGRYMVYKPPIDGTAPGRFVLHPVAEEEFTQSGWR